MKQITDPSINTWTGIMIFKFLMDGSFQLVYRLYDVLWVAPSWQLNSHSVIT